MQTIKVNIEKDGISYEFVTGRKSIARIYETPKYGYIAEMLRLIHPYGCRQEMFVSFEEANDFVCEHITRIFNNLGLDVEFVNA